MTKYNNLRLKYENKFFQGKMFVDQFLYKGSLLKCPLTDVGSSLSLTSKAVICSD